MTNEELLPKRQYIAIADVGDAELSIAITTNPDEHRRMVKEYTDGNVEFTYILASSLLKNLTNTDQELLQQAKDEVAEKAGYGWKTWEELTSFLFKYFGPEEGFIRIEKYSVKVYELAIQKAREEGIKGGEATGYDAGYSKGYEHGYESGQADLKSGFDRKLTAPGR